MRDLLTDPLWQAEDLGKPIPDSEHAVSVALPLWEHVVGYEEKDPAVIEAMWCGYPRFVIHPYVQELMRACADRFAGEQDVCVPFPSKAAAGRCQQCLAKREGRTGRIEPFDHSGIWVVTIAQELLEAAHEYRRYSGEIVSSRYARAALDGRAPDPSGEQAALTVKHRIAELTGQQADDVYLFPSGMAANFHLHRMLDTIHPDCMSIQMGFPYVDVLRVQRVFGCGAHFYPMLEASEIDALERLLDKEKISGVFTEFPNNTRLRCTDVNHLSEMLRRYGTPLIVDETIGSFYNIDVLRHADAAFTSLTKYFGGQGDIMAGSAVLNRESPHYAAFKAYLDQHYVNDLFADDAVALEENSRDFCRRMEKINRTAEAIFAYLQRHPLVDQVYYPLNQTPDCFAQLMRPGRGYGGLITLLLKQPEVNAPRFYDALRVNKGPTLGTNYTLACPYTLLAHYEELAWAEQCGISRYLIRLSVGLEDGDDLVRRLQCAFDMIS